MIDYDKRDMTGKMKYCNKEKKEKQILDKASGKLLGVVLNDRKQDQVQ